MLSREELMAMTPELRRDVAEVPEWGGEVTVREMTAGERDRFEAYLARNKQTSFRAPLAAYTVCDEDGKRRFSEKDIEWLDAWPAATLEKITVVALKLCKFTDSDVRELEKNSESGPPDASS